MTFCYRLHHIFSLRILGRYTVNMYSENILCSSFFGLDSYLFIHPIKFKNKVSINPLIRNLSSVPIAVGNREATEPCLLSVSGFECELDNLSSWNDNFALQLQLLLPCFGNGAASFL